MTTKRLDSRDGQVYVLPSTDPLWLAVRIAMTTGRPLLLRGDPGTGKSSLAAKVALDEKWRYYEHTVTPRTDATDLLWTFDSAVGRPRRRPTTPHPSKTTSSSSPAHCGGRSIATKPAFGVSRGAEPGTPIGMTKPRSPLANSTQGVSTMELSC